MSKSEINLVATPLNLSAEDQEILNDFLTEGRESLEEIEPLLVQIEESISNLQEVDSAVINKIFRAFHSLKGSAGFIGLTLTNAVTHQAETLLDLSRKGKIRLAKEHISIYLELCDFFGNLFDHIESTSSEMGFEQQAKDFVERLDQLANAESNDKTSPPAETSDSSKCEAESEEPAGIEMEDLITPEMISQFVQESGELLDGLEQDLLELEKDPANKSPVESAFRALHSLKGNAGFFGYLDISELCHKAESFLDDVRSGQTEPLSEQYSMILQVQDFLRTAVDNLANGGSPEIAGKSGLLDLMSEIFGNEQDENEAVTADPQETAQREELQNAPAQPGNEQARTISVSAPKASDTTAAGNQPPKTNGVKKANEVIRVDVNRLNTLMELVGEIVIAESMVTQHPDIAGRDMPEFEKAIIHLQKNIRELQELSTSMRMIPLNGLFRKMIRLVRDLSNKNNKKVDLEIIGGDTEVDRSIIEHISDPLVHIIRNSVDHGIEPAEIRKAAGKPDHGKIILEAKRVGGEIWISINDDGGGLNREKILAKAQERRIVNGKSEELSDEEIFNLIFAPGFSTAEKITSISGRGVGMDVVRKNVENIRGKIDVQSETGVGTTFILRIPLTTAIVDGMLLRVQNSLYALPMLDIKESLCVTDSNIVEMVDGQEVVRIRDDLYPVIRIHEIHKLGGNSGSLTEGILVLVKSGGKSACIFADELIGQKQLVIKPMPAYLGEIDGVSGCAILGDGNICMIFDVPNLIKYAESSPVLKEV